MSKLAAVLIVTAVAVSLAAAFFAPHPDSEFHLYVVDAKNGRMYFSCPIAEGDIFTLEYTHSVHKTPVTDYFVVENQKTMRLYQTAFATFGAGMPYTASGIIEYRDDAFIFPVVDRQFHRIQLHAVPMAEHRLALGNRTIYINDLVAVPARMAIYVD